MQPLSILSQLVLSISFRYPISFSSPSLCHFCGAVGLTNSQGETSAGVLARLACLSAQITWDSPNYPVANQSISWVSTGDAWPPFAVVTGGVIRCLFYCNPKNVPASRIHATGRATAMFQ